MDTKQQEIKLPNFYYEMKAKFYQVKIVRYINAMMEEVRVHSNRQPKLMW